MPSFYSCPKCGFDDTEQHVFLGNNVVMCGGCAERWNVRTRIGLSNNYCACCGRRSSWGCGHSLLDELEAVRSRSLGDYLRVLMSGRYDACDIERTADEYHDLFHARIRELFDDFVRDYCDIRERKIYDDGRL